MYKSQMKATAKYVKNHYDDIKLRVAKGERERLKQEITLLGYDSLNRFIVDAIDEKIEREKSDKDN